MVDSEGSDTRTFFVLATGQSIPRDAVHRGTTLDGEFVWHLYEREEF
jgi:hypothetical protein